MSIIAANNRGRNRGLPVKMSEHYSLSRLRRSGLNHSPTPHYSIPTNETKNNLKLRSIKSNMDKFNHKSDTNITLNTTSK